MPKLGNKQTYWIFITSNVVFTYYTNCGTPLRPYLINRIDLRVHRETQFGDLVFSTASLQPLYFSIWVCGRERTETAAVAGSRPAASPCLLNSTQVAIVLAGSSHLSRWMFLHSWMTLTTVEGQYPRRLAVLDMSAKLLFASVSLQRSRERHMPQRLHVIRDPCLRLIYQGYAGVYTHLHIALIFTGEA